MGIDYSLTIFPVYMYDSLLFEYRIVFYDMSQGTKIYYLLTRLSLVPLWFFRLSLVHEFQVVCIANCILTFCDMLFQRGNSTVASQGGQNVSEIHVHVT